MTACLPIRFCSAPLRLCARFSILHSKDPGLLAACVFLAVFAFGAGCRRAASPEVAPTTNAIRVVSLAPNITEIVCAVGGADCLVGRTDVCNYPTGIVARVPVVAGFGRPFLEPIFAQKPTLVLDAALEDVSLGTAMERLGIARRHIA